MLIQEQLNEAELILKTVLEDENITSREYLQALVKGYFKIKKKGNEMKLLTKEITEKAQKQYDKGSDLDGQMIVAKFFDPMGSWTWYLMNLADDKDYAWGIVDGHEVEMGSFSMKELASIQLPLGLGIERDMYFEPVKADKLWKELTSRETA